METKDVYKDFFPIINNQRKYRGFPLWLCSQDVYETDVEVCERMNLWISQFKPKEYRIESMNKNSFRVWYKKEVSLKEIDNRYSLILKPE